MTAQAAKRVETEAQGFALDHAWRELSMDGFGLWIRLQLEPRTELAKGKKPLARRLGIDHRTLHRLLIELRNKGYVRVLTEGPPVPATIILIRRAMLVGPTAFIKL